MQKRGLIRATPDMGLRATLLSNRPPGEYRILASKGNAELPFLEASYIASRADFIAIVNVVDGQTTNVEVTPVLDDSGPG